MAWTSDVIDCRQPVRKTPCCPDCGALECLCRPRFFAGQLLSEQDLNRLDQYIKNKNRLHNRNQHGWGVVNGLLVVCDPCGEVKVTQGYAVDPCGDDIVVCEDTRVNICELIRKCKQMDTQPECQPFRTPPNSNCNDIEEEWVLTINYREWASRGVTSLRGNTCGKPGCTSCGSGGSGSCECGGSCDCGGKTAKKAAYQKGSATALKNRGAPAQCEATVTCEGYNFGVYKKTEEDPQNDDDDRLIKLQGAFWDAFICCAQPLMDAIPPMPDTNNSSDSNVPVQANAISQWCCRFRDNLLKYFLSHRNTSCEVIDYLRTIHCPNVNNTDGFMQDFINSYMKLIAAWAEGLKNCLCLSLLPPPPPATCDVRVPLATVRIRARDCKVLSICNWTTERKIMVTWPAVMHWLSVVPIKDFIRELLDRLCCQSLLGIFDDVIDEIPRDDPLPGTADTIPMMDTNAMPNFDGMETNSFGRKMHLASGSLGSKFSLNLGKQMEGFSMLAAGMVTRGGKPLELGAVLNALSPRFKLPDNGQKLNAVEAKNLPLLLLSEVTVKPVLTSFIGSKRATEKVKEFQAGLAGGAGKTANVTDTDLRKEMEAMRKKMDKQDKQIKDLMKKVSG